MYPIIAMLACAALAGAVTELPSIIGPHMVLQRERQVPIWGWDEPGRTVTVGFRDGSVSVVAGADGRWEASVTTGPAGGPFELRIDGSTGHRLADILVGEVWIAGGQSNMWWQLRNCLDGEATIAASDRPSLRWYDANTGAKEAGWPSERPQRSVETRWQVSHPSVAADFAGTAYHFARGLQEHLGVPVGIVHVAVPGTGIESWMRGELLRGEFSDLLKLQELRRNDPAPAGAGERRQKDADGAVLWNGMVAPCAPFAAKGFLWWQGEHNAGQPGLYRALFPALINDWRQQFRLAEAPFLFVELAGFGTRATQPVEDAAWPALRDAQRSALRLPGTAMVCTLDILREYGWEIHPPDKALAGNRLLRAAQALAYGEAIVWSGPQPVAWRFNDGQAEIDYTHAEGLGVRGGGDLVGFALAGDDGAWHDGQAAIHGTTVRVIAPQVPRPAAVRYAWQNNPRGCNLTNAAGLPASQFRSDTWALLTRAAGR